MNMFTITARFPTGEFNAHGRDGEPEWPPSPARLASAVLAAAHASGKNVHVAESLFALRPPCISSPPFGLRRVGYGRWVPVNNEVKDDGSGIVDDNKRFGENARKSPERGVLVGTSRDDVVRWVFAEDIGVDLDVLRTLVWTVSYLGRPTSPVILDLVPRAQEAPAGHDRWQPDAKGDVSLRVATRELLRALDEREKYRRDSEFTGTHRVLDVRPVARYRHEGGAGEVYGALPVVSMPSAVLEGAVLYRFPRGRSGDVMLGAGDAPTVADQIRTTFPDLDWMFPLFGDVRQGSRSLLVMKGVLVRTRSVPKDLVLAVRGGVATARPAEPGRLGSLPRVLRAATAPSRIWTSVVPTEMGSKVAVDRSKGVAERLGVGLQRVERHKFAFADVGPDVQEPSTAYHLSVAFDREVSGPVVLDKVWFVPRGATGLAVNERRRALISPSA